MTPTPTPTKPVLSDQQRADEWHLSRQRLQIPLTLRADLISYNTIVGSHPVRRAFLPVEALRPADRGLVFGNNHMPAPQEVVDIMTIIEASREAFSATTDVQALVDRGKDFSVSLMTTCTLGSAFRDSQATTLALGVDFSVKVAEAKADVKRNAAEGKPAAIAVVPLLEASESKAKEAQRAGQAEWDRAFAMGQGEGTQKVEDYEQAVQVIAHQGQLLTMLRHELALRGGGSGPLPGMTPPPAPNLRTTTR